MRIALSRIAAGQSDIALVGGAYNGERRDLLLLYEFGGCCLKGTFAPVWERGRNGGFALGSLGAFLVHRSRASMREARGAKPLARLTAVLSDRVDAQARRRRPPRCERLWDSDRAAAEARQVAVHFRRHRAPNRRPREERAFLGRAPDIPVRATGTYIGHGDGAAVRHEYRAGRAGAQPWERCFRRPTTSGVERPMARRSSTRSS